ncbi:uncharacterized protein BO87DRAFT_314648, partial [Aspergillus neoniger CBS 115656]
ATPHKVKGNTSKLSDEEVDHIIYVSQHIIYWILSSKRTRRLLYYHIIEELNLPVGVTALTCSLKKRDYTCYKVL